MISRLFVTVVETHCSPAKVLFLGFNSDAVVHRVLQPLPAPKVLFRRLHAHMAEQKLDLLKLPASDVTEPSTRAAKIMSYGRPGPGIYILCNETTSQRGFCANKY